MLYREIIALCSQMHTKHINTLCGQNAELLNVIAPLACEPRAVRREKLSVKCGGRMTRVCSKMIFLPLSRQRTIPQILRLEFPMQTWGPKEKCKKNELRTTNILKNPCM